MSGCKPNTRKKVLEPEISNSDKRKRRDEDLDLDFDVEISSNIKGIMSALQQIREKAQKDGQKKNDETISSVADEIRAKIDDMKSKFEKDRQSFARALSKSFKEVVIGKMGYHWQIANKALCENSLRNETSKFQALYEKFCKEKAAHLQSLKETISKFEEEKERLFMKYEQLRKKERNMISEHEKDCADKITQLEESLKKKKHDDKTFNILRKTLGSFLEPASDEDFPPDDD